MNTADVAERMTASRGTVREVVRVLESLGLVEVRRRAGVVILPSARWNPYAPQVIRWKLAGPNRWRTLHEISELRLVVEPLAARLASEHAAREQRRVISASAFGMSQTSDHATEDEYLGHDVRFHRTVLEASGNPMLAALGDVVAEVLTGRTHQGLMPRRANKEAVGLHQEIAALISRSEGEAAARAMTRIVSEADEAIDALMREEGRPARRRQTSTT